MIAEYFLDTCRQVYSELNRVVTIMDMQKNTSNAILNQVDGESTVSYTHLRAHETVLDLVCRILLEKKKHKHHHHSL